jgi:AraC-like DNA-binding protein
MILNVCTDSVPRHRRHDYWRAIRESVFGDRCRIESAPATPFRASLSLVRHGALVLADCHGSPSRVLRDGCAEAGSVAVLMQRKGECRLRHDRGEMLLPAGHFCLFPADAVAELELPNVYRQYSLRVPASLASGRFSDWRQSAYSPMSSEDGAAGLFLDLVQGLQRHAESSSRSCCTEALDAMLGLLGVALSERTDAPQLPPEPRMASYHKARIRHFVLEHLADPDLDVARIAEAVRLSPRYLHRLFADEPMRLMHWIWSERLERCLNALTRRDGTPSSVSAVAYTWGFNDAAHFSRAFRKRYGVCPRDVQSALR